MTAKRTTFCQDFKFLGSTLSQQYPSNLLILQRLVSMAGLQYNFFPTDFFYPPRPVKIQKREAMITDDLNRENHPTSLVLRHSKHGNKSHTPMNKSSAA
ncbi:hypothetical protein SADUNF_Sadunf16G0038900 [Salix dunnii]|uniref:Uncharacterized protein n=1 Tax=Salix dunnii TaxID=1413687 RepID=A0A835J7W7_9ROSI|nr:hypothetical protein SADUNF_Sadunf16G0038900 [Salix dunnii]